jgi:hypothetical protein
MNRYVSGTIRSGTCSKCGARGKFEARSSWVAELKFDWWLYWHYKKEHSTDIIIKTILFKLRGE